MKLIIFDLDGVLIDSKENMKLSWLSVKKKFNLKQSFKKYFENIGLPFFDILKRIGIKNQKENIQKLYNKKSIKNFNKIKLYPNVKKTLIYLKKKKYKIAIVTSKNQLRTNKILNKFNLNIFDVVVAPKKKLKGKPYPDQILYAMSRLKVKNKHSCYIGDMNVDFKSAKNSNVRFIFAKYGYGKFKKSYTNSINSIDELRKINL
tara:strand:+ start:552 stop:1163 length:612 start_codon:yes stop_codon:yes gene_type:complete